MPLLASNRHTKDDLRAWDALERQDKARAHLGRLARLEATSMQWIREFGTEDAYVGVSWGKDSLVVADLALRVYPDIRIAWFPAGPIENPDCQLVRDAYLKERPVHYDEIEASVSIESWWGHDGAQKAFEAAASMHGKRYLSGIRAEESGGRKLRMLYHGVSTRRTCAPIGYWTTDDVYAYLAKYDLPIHPAYGCLWGGIYDRNRLRVGTIGGKGGAEFGRREWERRYYGQELDAVLALYPEIGEL